MIFYAWPSEAAAMAGDESAVYSDDANAVAVASSFSSTATATYLGDVFRLLRALHRMCAAGPCTTP